MRFVLSLLALALVVGFVGVSLADDKKDEKKDTTLAGKITCGKCDLGKDKKCATVIVVKADDKETVYYFDTDSDKKYHKEICQGGKEGKVVGAVSEKDGKKTVKVSKLEWTEK